MSAILQELLRVSEKAAHIARACRQQDALFQLLIEEKKGAEKNKKFAVDFKTLADVLVQEVIKQHMESKDLMIAYSGGQSFVKEGTVKDLDQFSVKCSNVGIRLEEKIFGEESSEFTNALGEMIVLRLCPTEEETAELLSKVLNGNQLAAGALAKVVHEDAAFADPALDSVQVTIPQDTLGIWVDPIDSTHQYIQGSADVEPSHGVFPRGLACVTILIGVYDLQTGLPLMGVINQPFVTQDPVTLRWEGRRFWGLSYMGTNIHSLLPPVSEPQTGHPGSGSQAEDTGSQAAGAPRFSAVISASERETVQAALARVCGGRVFHAAGAGYKGLCVVQGLVDMYVFSYDTTFKWDSCAPHAILRAMGGGMVDFQGCLARGPASGREPPQLLYHLGNKGASGVDHWANRGGLIAYRSRQQLETFLSLLAQHLAPADAPPAPADTPADARA